MEIVFHVLTLTAIGHEHKKEDHVVCCVHNNRSFPPHRAPHLYFVKGEGNDVVVVKFEGADIKGYCTITGSRSFEIEGICSNTTYYLNLGSGVRTLLLVTPMYGVWGDDLNSWGEVAEKLELPMDFTKKIVRDEYPTAAERLDKLEAFALAVEAKGGVVELVVVSFGSPTWHQAHEGYWGLPKDGQTCDGHKVVVKPEEGEHGAGWSKPVVEPEGAVLISSRSIL